MEFVIHVLGSIAPGRVRVRREVEDHVYDFLLWKVRNSVQGRVFRIRAHALMALSEIFS